MRIRTIAAACAVVCLCSFSGALAQEDLAARLNRLDAELSRQAETIREQQKVIEELKSRLSGTVSAENRAKPELSANTTTAGSMSSGIFGGSLMTNPYVSVILDAKGYVSNQKNGALASRGVPGYTTEGQGLKNGFNVDAAELMIFAPVDPYFNLYTNIPVTDAGATLEEAYVVTTALPEGFQIKGGRFKSNATRLNSQHPHAWDFADLPLPYRAFLGPEGIGGDNGVQLTWMPPTPVYTLLGFEALQGSNPLLFGDDDSWGPHAFTAFGRVSIDTSDNSSLYLSPWVMFGSTRTGGILPADNVTGNSFNLRGNSVLYGMEALWKWKSGLRKMTLQGEYLYLVQNGTLTEIDPVGAQVGTVPLQRHQDGFYLQALYGFDRWTVGTRYDRMEIFADTITRDGVQQPYSGRPWRLTGSLEYNFTEFSRLRAQFSHDRSDRGGRVNNEGILQFTFTIGAHAAHAY